MSQDRLTRVEGIITQIAEFQASHVTHMAEFEAHSKTSATQASRTASASERNSDSKLLATILEKQEARLVELWRSDLESYNVQMRNFKESSVNDIQALAIDLAKNGSQQTK